MPSKAKSDTTKATAKVKAKEAKDLKKFKSNIEWYLYEVEKCVKAGGKSMDCKIKVQDARNEKDKEKKAKKPKKK